MPTAFLSTNSIGPGERFAFAASNDLLLILPGVTMASTDVFVPVTLGMFTGLSISVLGTLSGPSMTIRNHCAFHVGPQGRFLANANCPFVGG